MQTVVIHLDADFTFGGPLDGLQVSSVDEANNTVMLRIVEGNATAVTRVSLSALREALAPRTA